MVDQIDSFKELRLKLRSKPQLPLSTKGLFISNDKTENHMLIHLRFKQAQQKIRHSSKVGNGVEIFF